jgi:hypothetical protein
MTAWGDLNIEFSVRNPGDADVDRAATLDDVLAMTRAVYSLPRPRPLNVTMIGVWRASPSDRAVPVLYASMPADRLYGLDWNGIRGDDLHELGVVRWLPAGVCQAWRDCGKGLG